MHEIDPLLRKAHKKGVALTDIVTCWSNKQRSRSDPESLTNILLAFGCPRKYKGEDRLGSVVEEVALQSSTHALYLLYTHSSFCAGDRHHEDSRALQLYLQASGDGGCDLLRGQAVPHGVAGSLRRGVRVLPRRRHAARAGEEGAGGGGGRCHAYQTTESPDVAECVRHVPCCACAELLRLAPVLPGHAGPPHPPAVSPHGCAVLGRVCARCCCTAARGKHV